MLGIVPSDAESSDSRLAYGDGAGVQPTTGGSDIQTADQKENNMRYAAEDTVGERVRAVPIVAVAPTDAQLGEAAPVNQAPEELKTIDGHSEEVKLVPAPDAVVAREAEASVRQGTLNQPNPQIAANEQKGAPGTQSGESGKAAVTGLTPPGGADAPPAGPGPKSPNGPATPGGGNATNGANGNNSNGKSALGDAAGLLKRLNGECNFGRFVSDGILRSGNCKILKFDNNHQTVFYCKRTQQR
jgi:hypothetical protein